MTNILYTRVSTNSQGSMSLDAQNQICLNYLNSKGLMIDHSYQEIGSAFNGSQKKLRNIFEKHSNCNLWVLNVSRFSRNIENGLNFLKTAENKNINVCFIEENMESKNKSTKHQIRVKLSEAQAESETVSNRVSSMMKILQGKGWNLGNPEYGKESVMKNGKRKFVTSKSERDIVNFILQARNGVSCKQLNSRLKKVKPNADPIDFIDKDGVSKLNYFDKTGTLTFEDIADLLNDYEITKRGKSWTGSSVNHVYKTFFNLENLKTDLVI